jgi:hypothetical protein
MTFDYRVALGIVQRWKQHPGLPLEAFVPRRAPELDVMECGELAVATGIPVAEIEQVFLKE